MVVELVSISPPSALKVVTILGRHTSEAWLKLEERWRPKWEEDEEETSSSEVAQLALEPTVEEEEPWAVEDAEPPL